MALDVEDSETNGDEEELRLERRVMVEIRVELRMMMLLLDSFCFQF